MDPYQAEIKKELDIWKKKMLRKPTIISRLSKGIQTKINSWIPERVHVVITSTLKQMIRGVLFGASYTSVKPLSDRSIEAIEKFAFQRIDFYRTTASGVMFTERKYSLK